MPGWINYSYGVKLVNGNMNSTREISPESDLRTSIQTFPIAEVYRALGTGPSGLSQAEAEERLRRYGRNTILEVKRKPLYLKFFANFTHLMAILLWTGGIFAFIGNLPQLGWAIWAVVVINAVFSFWQEFKAEKAMEALRRLLPVYARVIRDGEERRILAEELVPGDVILLSEGDHISADGRLVQEAELSVDHSTLSGESHPVRKTADAFLRKDLCRTEITNLVFAGTSVASGAGRAVVFATCMETEFGKIAHLTLGLEEEVSPLQKEINRMTRVVTVMAVGIGVIFFLLSVTVVGRPISAGFIFAIGMIVAFVPEGLLPTVTLALAMGVLRMAGRNALIKKLSSVETLGCCTVICTDKTGTLTQNEMTVRNAWIPGRKLAITGVGYAPGGEILNSDKHEPVPVDDDARLMFLVAGLCNDARLLPANAAGDSWAVLGDPTEGALRVAAHKAAINLEAEEQHIPRQRELPFDSRRKMMSTIHRVPEAGNPEVEHREWVKALDTGLVAFVKGAPKEILGLCTRIRVNGEVRPLRGDMRTEATARNDEYARSGLRVLAVAMRPLPDGFSEYTTGAIEKDLVFLGLVAMMDPPRPEVAKAVGKCHQAGIRIIMITGDYGLTAESIARRIGIIHGGRPRIISGADLDTMNDGELMASFEGDVIFARVAPEHKLRVVGVLRNMGHVVAVTGDGVNDAPALKKADIGVAMGVAGTDVAKEAADMVLTDDNFASIVNAIEEGRAVYANIKKFATYIFTSNVPEAWPFIFQILFNIPLALTVMQVLAIDLGTDMVPALALGCENPEPDVMEKPPRSQTDRLIDGPLLLRALAWQGSLQAGLCFAGFFFLFWTFDYHDLFHLPRTDLLPYAERLSSQDGSVYVMATTIFLAGVVAAQIGNAYACRTERTSVFTIGFFSNRLLLIGIIVELAVVNILIYVQPFREIFELSPFPLHFWLLLLLYPPVIFLLEEARKAVWRVRKRRNSPVGGTP